MFYHETMGTMADQSKLYKTFSFRVQDSTSGKKLVRLGTKVNFVWNYCNDVSKRSARRVGPWGGKKQLIDLTKGSSKEIGLPSQIVQNVERLRGPFGPPVQHPEPETWYRNF